MNLSVLSALFASAPKKDFETWISATPGGANTRRVWFIYEWMTGQLLDVPPVPKIRAVPVIDQEKQFGLEGGERSARQSVVDNLPDECVKQTVERDLPDEVAYLEAYDHFSRGVLGAVDMPNSMVDLLHRFLKQHGGKLSRRARETEFAPLTDEEVGIIEAAYAKAFTELKPRPGEAHDNIDDFGETS